MTNKTTNTCPVCGTAIPEDAPGGLCPKCVLAGAETVTNPPTSNARKAAPASVEEIAPHFPDLEIIELLGAGGMGAVYKARQPQLDRYVALKILSRDLAGDPAFVERFNREARVLARLSHPNIVAVFDFGMAGSHCYLLMEYVDGVNLRQAMRTGGFTPAEALALVQEICSALKFAHEEGILHRDIKPENILIDTRGRVKIADFGIAKLVGESAPDQVTLTLQGSILGTPHYMAPEQIETPGDVDQRADIYSLGVVLYEMLTGELPIGRFALPSQKAAMDARIDEIVLRTLEKEREARFQSAEEVRTSVGALAQSPPVPAPHPDAGTSGEAGTARFSLASAILTGISLPLGLVAAYMFSANHAEVPAIVKAIGAAWALFNLLALLGTALPGFILGARALGEIRKSGGTKDGLGFAIFAVVGWPILLFGIIGLLSLNMVPSDGPGGGIGTSAAVLVAGVPLLLAVFILIRGLRRWARGVERDDGRKHFPGLTGTVLATLGLALLGPVLAAVLPAMFGPSHGGDSHEEAMAYRQESEDLMKQATATSYRAEEVRWRLGKPEVEIPIRVLPGQRMSLRLVLRDENGRTTWTTDLGELEAQPGASPAKAFLKVGTFLKPDDRKGAIHALAAVRTGRNAHTSKSVEDLRGWTFETDFPNELISFVKPIVSTLRIATSGKKEPEGAKGVLSLEVEVTDQGKESPGKDRQGAIDWYRGSPEFTLPMRIHDSLRAEFRLALFDGERNPQQYAEIGAWEPSLRRSQIKINELETCVVRVGTTPPKEDGGGKRGMTALIESTGKSGTLNAETDFAEWVFDFPERTFLLAFPLATAGSYDCTLLKREETVDGKTRLTGVLRLEVRLFER